MTDYEDDFSLRALWQTDDVALAPLPLDEIKRRASRLGDVVRRRNRVEYGAAAIVLVAFALYAVILPGALFKVASLLVIAERAGGGLAACAPHVAARRRCRGR
ncbi:hypothetical protein [Sphingopyxis sp. PET50]|uniref:hypothetical protein n=1 Tax=Sphingopyxis sp. PET50 TaxID=2976533 RepID=UPI0021AF5F60|nr:hypothetical protein [Sphingopyxis sp. PET50]